MLNRGHCIFFLLVLMFNFSLLHKYYCLHQEQCQWKRSMCVLTLIHQLNGAAELLFCPVSCKKNDQQWRESQTFLCHLFFPPRKIRKEGLPTKSSLSFLPFLPFQCLSSISWHNFHIKRWAKNKDLLQKLVMKRLCLNPDRGLDALKSYSDNDKIWTKKSHYRGFRRFSCSILPVRPL